MLNFFPQIFADRALYYIQHGLMLVIPYYLLRIGGNYLYFSTDNDKMSTLIYL